MLISYFATWFVRIGSKAYNTARVDPFYMQYDMIHNSFRCPEDRRELFGSGGHGVGTGSSLAGE